MQRRTGVRRRISCIGVVGLLYMLSVSRAYADPIVAKMAACEPGLLDDNSNANALQPFNTGLGFGNTPDERWLYARVAFETAAGDTVDGAIADTTGIELCYQGPGDATPVCPGDANADCNADAQGCTDNDWILYDSHGPGKNKPFPWKNSVYSDPAFTQVAVDIQL